MRTAGGVAISVTIKASASINEIPLTTLAGESTTLAAYDGTVKLIVTVASRCGLAPEYEQLE